MTGKSQWTEVSGQWTVTRSYLARKSKDQRPKTKSQSGFSLLELMISMFILIILLSVALPTYQRSVQHARETVLKENLWQMRKSIDQYAADKGKLPKSIDDLVEAKYLRDRPVDPITETDQWDEVSGPDPSSAEGEEGLVNVKCTSPDQDSDGKNYNEY